MRLGRLRGEACRAGRALGVGEQRPVGAVGRVGVLAVRDDERPAGLERACRWKAHPPSAGRDAGHARRGALAAVATDEHCERARREVSRFVRMRQPARWLRAIQCGIRSVCARFNSQSALS
eukprot:851380-Prymnesium_polylepis.1